ncbi:hypothetical protein HMPREF1982_00051 [Clostridiales bacterium oral taxon 876 str. F0540]|nr:hypothetical protein HMPREF1982_00051 [Clostridiales bacterium oral taxon 876 str. F0540]
MVSMKKRLILMTSLVMVIGIFSGCSKEKAVETVNRVSYDKKFTAPYTGEVVDEKTSKNIPFMAIIENSNDARPQSGLVDADIVYETMAEGGIPRFIALFQKNTPEKIGPIRSARAYFLNISREYNLPFAHCGYSEEAENMIKKDNLMTLNEFTYTGFYWRDNERKAPHNLYSSAKRLREVISNRGYTDKATNKPKFNKDFWLSDNSSKASSILLKLNKYYSTSYIYRDGKYYKAMNEEASFNKEDKRPIAVTNVVVQTTNIKLQKDNQHLDITLVGEGTGYVFSNGKYTKMTWSRKDITSPTILKDENGLDIPLNPGNTWWHIIDKSNPVEIK